MSNPPPRLYCLQALVTGEDPMMLNEIMAMACLQSALDPDQGGMTMAIDKVVLSDGKIVG